MHQLNGLLAAIDATEERASEMQAATETILKNMHDLQEFAEDASVDEVTDYLLQMLDRIKDRVALGEAIQAYEAAMSQFRGSLIAVLIDERGMSMIRVAKTPGDHPATGDPAVRVGLSRVRGGQELGRSGEVAP